MLLKKYVPATVVLSHSNCSINLEILVWVNQEILEKPFCLIYFIGWLSLLM